MRAECVSKRDVAGFASRDERSDFFAWLAPLCSGGSEAHSEALRALY